MWTWFLSFAKRSDSLRRDANRRDVNRAALKLEALESREVPAILIQVDYTYDTGFFRNNPEARATMERVAAELGNSISANLSAIIPSGGNTWTATFFNPGTGSQAALPNLAVGANTIRLFVGGRPLGGSEAGFGGPGGYSASGSQAWLNTLRTRGWSGFSLWGGSITFASNSNWHFGQTTAGLDRDELDFYSVATHELGHVLGLGTASQWDNLRRNGSFVGPNASAVYGGAVPLAPDGAHWADGVTLAGQSVSLDPSITFGTRVNFTALDVAALRDLGWATAPISPPTPAPAPTPVPQPTPPTFNRVPLGSPQQPVAFASNPDGSVTLFITSGGALVNTGTRLTPFPGYRGAIRVASGDFNADGVSDYVFTTGAGPQAVVKIMDGRTGGTLVDQTAIYPGFRGGLFVAAADIDRDGISDLVVSADAGAGPHIQTFRVSGGGLSLMSSFFAFDNPAYRGGARVAAGDLNRDGFADVVVTTGGLAEGRVAMYSGADLRAGIPTRLFPDFHAFAGFGGGLYASVGDMNGDGFGELAVTPDRGGPAHVKVWSGLTLTANPGTPTNLLPLTASFYGLPPTDVSGGRLAMRDMDGDGRSDLVVASGNRQNGIARGFNFEQMVFASGGVPIYTPLDSRTTFDGIYVGLSLSLTESGEASTTETPALLDSELPGDATYTVTADPVTHKCTCAGCLALAQLVKSTEE
ncbi:MAG: hypothetical protein L0241_21505 [Planctomycetia bacterium]|nr:hypothetical protein [Planctomycetia bacterium]